MKYCWSLRLTLKSHQSKHEQDSMKILLSIVGGTRNEPELRMIHRFFKENKMMAATNGAEKETRRTDDRNTSILCSKCSIFLEASSILQRLLFSPTEATLSFAFIFYFFRHFRTFFNKKSTIISFGATSCINIVDNDPRTKYIYFTQEFIGENQSQSKMKTFYHDFVTSRYYDNRIKSQFRLICDDSIDGCLLFRKYQSEWKCALSFKLADFIAH